MNDATPLPAISQGSLATIIKSEIDQQITTAKAFPRSVTGFRNAALELSTLSEAVAKECMYALPRDGKVIEGPSARMAEILVSSWGNCRAGARVIDEGLEFVTAEGVFHDLESNAVTRYETKRRITDKNGRRYKPDMIATTANAACSIALRNAVLKGIPKALWNDIYLATRKTAAGDAKSLATNRADAIKAFQVWGVDQPRILKVLGVSSVEDIGLEDLAKLRGIYTAIKEEDLTPEEAFPVDRPAASGAPAAKPGLDEFAKGVDPETGEIRDEKGAGGPDTPRPAPKEAGRSQEAAGQGDTSSPASGGIPASDPVAEARALGLRHAQEGRVLRAMPAEYRAEGREEESGAYQEGFKSWKGAA